MRKRILAKLSSFSVQLFLCIFATAVVLLSAGLMLLHTYSVSATTKLNNTMMEQNLMISANHLEAGLSEVDYLARLVFYQEDILQTLKRPYSQPSAPYTKIRHALITAMVSSDLVSHMEICDSWGNYIGTESYLKSIPYKTLDECRSYFSGAGEHVSTGLQDWYFLQVDPFDPRDAALANVRTIDLGIRSDDPVLLMHISEEKLAKHYSFLGESSFLVTKNGTVISAADKSLLGISVDGGICEQLAKIRTAGSFQISGVQYHAVALPTIQSYLVVRADSQALADVNYSTAVVTAMVLLFGMLFSLLFSQIISRTMTKPLIRLKEKMEQVQSGDLTVRCHTDRQDEIGYLYNSFNYMMDMVNQYLEQHDYQHALARKTELQLMQAQINPHLLYNSLDSALCLLNGDDSSLSVRVLEELSQFFRLSLQRGSRVVTVEMAIELAKTYLQLQNLCRMKDYKLTVSGDLSVLQESILHMCLQPIVENAVVHGLDGNYSEGHIDIHLARDGSDILICILDDGIGMDDGQLQALRRKLTLESVEAGYGLWNVAQRIKMYYGERYSLQIESEFGDHTAVTLRIPTAHPERTEEDSFV